MTCDSDLNFKLLTSIQNSPYVQFYENKNYCLEQYIVGLILAELGCDFINCLVFCFRNFKPYIYNEEYLCYDEDDEYVRSKSKLKYRIQKLKVIIKATDF